jgi:hypothetical protein
MENKGIFHKAFSILFYPDREWRITFKEAKTKNQILKGYAIPFILIAGGASLIGNFVFDQYFSFSLDYTVCFTLLQVVNLFFTVFISSYLINELLPVFGSRKDIDISFSLVAYSFTAVFISYTIASLIPYLAFIQILGLYTFYLYWAGVSIQLNLPEHKKAGFIVVSLVIMLSLYLILRIVFGFGLSFFIT